MSVGGLHSTPLPVIQWNRVGIITLRPDFVTPDDLGVLNSGIFGMCTSGISSIGMNAALTLSKEILRLLLLMFTFKYLSYLAMILYGPS